MNNYVVYHLHDEMSLLDSVTKFTDYVDMAIENNMKAIACTNHGNIYHWIERVLYCQEKGIQMLPGGQGFNAQQAKKDFVNSSSVLSQSASLADDGTLNISLNIPCNVGSHAGEVYTVNQNEAEYQERRERFGRFLDSIPGNIYLDNQKEKKMT